MLGLCLSSISFIGITLWNHQVFKLPFHLSGFLTSGWIILVLTFGGTIGYLAQFYNGLLFIGSVYFFYRLIKDIFITQRMNSVSFTPLNVTVGFLLVLMGLALSQLNLSHYDNFSHWALATKYLITFHALPTADQSIVTFTAYPLGSSLFSYFWLGHRPFHEGLLIVTHWGLMILSLNALMQLLTKKINQPISYAVLLLVLLIISWLKFVPLNSVLVDDLIAVYAVGIIAGQVYLRNHLKQLALFTAVMTGALSLIKNSALFFVVIIYLHFIVLWIHYLRKNQLKGQGKLASLGLSLTTFIPFIGWQYYLKIQFAGTTSSKHAIDLDAYTHNASQKTVLELAQIRQTFMDHLSFNRPIMAGIYSILALFLCLYLIYRWKKIGYWWIREVFLLCAVTTVGYVVSLYYMYIYSMPTHEAIRLASFYRYMETLYVFLFVYLAMIVLLLLNTLSNHWVINLSSWLGLILALCSIGIFSWKYMDTYQKSHDEMVNKAYSIRQLVETVMEPIQSLSILSNDEASVGSGYFYYVGTFYTMSEEVEVAYTSNEVTRGIEKIGEGDYVLYVP